MTGVRQDKAQRFSCKSKVQYCTLLNVWAVPSIKPPSNTGTVTVQKNPPWHYSVARRTAGARRMHPLLLLMLVLLVDPAAAVCTTCTAGYFCSPSQTPCVMCVMRNVRDHQGLLVSKRRCRQPTAGPKRDVPTLDVCGLKIAVRVTLLRFTASLWIAVQERSL